MFCLVLFANLSSWPRIFCSQLLAFLISRHLVSRVFSSFRALMLLMLNRVFFTFFYRIFVTNAIKPTPIFHTIEKFDELVLLCLIHRYALLFDVQVLQFDVQLLQVDAQVCSSLMHRYALQFDAWVLQIDAYVLQFDVLVLSILGCIVIIV